MWNGAQFRMKWKPDPNHEKGEIHMKKELCLFLALLLFLPSLSLAANEPIELPIGDYDTDKLTVAVYDNYYAAASYADPLPVLEWVEKRTGIQIDWDVTVPSQYDEIMRVRLAAGQDLPDIVQVPGGLKEVYKYAQQGILLPLDDLIREYAPNLAKLIWEDMPELGRIYTAPDGHIYHIAQNYDGGNKVEVKGLLLRTDWLGTLGLEQPVTADDWYHVLKAFKEGDPNGNGLADEIPMTAFSTGNGLEEYGYLATAFNLAAPVTKYIDVDGVAVNQYEQPGFKDFLSFLNKLYSEGLLDPQYSTGDEAKLDAMCAKDIVGASAHYATKTDLWAGTAAKAGNPNSAKAEYHLMLSPANPDGSIRIISRALTGFCYGITRDCKDPIKAIKWLDYIYGSDEGRDTLLYGLEGLTYTLDADGNKVWMDNIANNPDGLSIATALRSVGAFPAQFTNRTVEFYKMIVSKSAAEEGEILQKYMIQPFPQVMGLEDELDRIASLNADIETYENEMIQKFVMGQVPLTEFDTFIQTVKAMGGDELTQIYQDQLDRYYQK